MFIRMPCLLRFLPSWLEVQAPVVENGLRGGARKGKETSHRLASVLYARDPSLFWACYVLHSDVPRGFVDQTSL